MNEQKRSEVLAFFWFIVSVLTLLSLMSYTPEDIPFEISTPNYPAHNYVGIAGAYTAWVLSLLFGKTAYLLVPLFLVWAVLKWSGKRGQKAWVKIFSTTVFITSACALFSLLWQDTESQRFNAGGVIGFYISGAIAGIFGHASVFVAASLFVLAILLATELLVLRAAWALFSRVNKALGPRLAEMLESRRAASKAGVTPAAKTQASPKAPEKPKPAFGQPAPAKPAGAPKASPEKPEKEKAEKPEARQPAFAAAEPLPAKPQIKLSVPKPEPKPEPKPAKIVEPEPANEGVYRLPSVDLLESPKAIDQSQMQSNLEESSRVLEDTLRDFGIDAKVVEVEQGPTITRYELQPAAGVKVQRITSLENDIALAMRATSVRIIAPIPGKSRVGIEVPNSAAATVYIREILTSQEYKNEKSRVAIAIGKDTAGGPLVCDLAAMPHLLIAGATNTGKSVCINSIVTSILFRSTPDEVKFLMIDPKMVELHFYNDLPHLICPVVTDKSKAPAALAWLISEMERRYRVLSKVGAKNIVGFNEKVESKLITPESLNVDESNADEPVIVKKMPYIVLLIDELADLMLASGREVETAITRLAQLARAVGIHMILATQRPSVDIITGVIKANFPARIAFQVASKVDSRTILDENGADKLLGRGDLLLMDPRKSKLVRGQGAWVQDSEIERITSFIKGQRKAAFTENIFQAGKKQGLGGDAKRDEMYEEAKRVVLETGQASTSMLQRKLGLGYTRAARIIDMMEEDGVVGPFRGAKPREILVERPNAQPVSGEAEE